VFSAFFACSVFLEIWDWENIFAGRILGQILLRICGRAKIAEFWAEFRICGSGSYGENRI
jgi:hypothetical protein